MPVLFAFLVGPRSCLLACVCLIVCLLAYFLSILLVFLLAFLVAAKWNDRLPTQSCPNSMGEHPNQGSSIHFLDTGFAIENCVRTDTAYI